MTFAEWHPDDERLLTRYVEGADPSVDRHLSWCVSCTRRLSEISADLDAVYLAADDEAAGAFSRERLAAQRRSVQQRLGAALPARVLPFPAGAGVGRYQPFMRVAAAALLVALSGAGLVRVAYMAETTSGAGMRAATTITVSPGRLARDVAADPALEDIEMALAQPRTAELWALDALTPHVRDIVAPIR